jgi:hypothetical protein
MFVMFNICYIAIDCNIYYCGKLSVMLRDVCVCVCSRQKYTLAEDLAIIKHLVNSKAVHRVGGLSLWTSMESYKVCVTMIQGTHMLGGFFLAEVLYG